MYLPSWRIGAFASPEGLFFYKIIKYRKEIIIAVFQTMQWEVLTEIAQQLSGEVWEQKTGVSVQGQVGEDLVEQSQLNVTWGFPALCWLIAFP